MWLEPAGEGALSFLHWWDEERRSMFLYLKERKTCHREARQAPKATQPASID